MTTHPFREGAPFRLLIGTSNSWGLSTLFPHTLVSLILSPSCFATCGNHLSRKTAIVFSLLYCVGGGWGGGGGCTHATHGRNRMTIDPRIPTMPGRSMLSFHRRGRGAYSFSARLSHLTETEHREACLWGGEVSTNSRNSGRKREEAGG